MTVRIDVHKTPDGKFQAYCDECGYTAQRSKKEAVVHLLTQHATYTHEAQEVTTSEF